jgi:hypothetical protein
MSNTSKKKWAIVSLVGFPVVALTIYCGYQIANTGKPVSTSNAHLKPVERPLTESDRVWGATPSSACAALQNANVVTTAYSLIDAEKNLYGCATSEIEIPDQKNKKTLQYTVTGFSDKATNIKLVMRIGGDQTTNDAIVAKKTWAIYSAVLAQTVFSEQLNENDMQELANLKEGVGFKRNYKLKLISDAHYEKINKVGVYTYEIRGLPVLDGG